MRNSLIFGLAALAFVASNFAHAGDGTTPLPSQYRVNVPDEEQYPDDQQQEPQYAPVQQQAPPVVVNNYYNQTNAGQFEAPGYGLDQGFDASFCQISYAQDQNGIIATIVAGDPDNGWQQLWQDYVGPNFINLRITSNALQLMNGGDPENGYCQNFGIADVSDYGQYGNGYYPRPFGYRGDRLGFGLGYGGGYVSPRYIPGRNGFDSSLQYRQGTSPRDFVQQRGVYGRGGLVAVPNGGQFGGRRVVAPQMNGQFGGRQVMAPQQFRAPMAAPQMGGQFRAPMAAPQMGGQFRAPMVAPQMGGQMRGPVAVAPMGGQFRGNGGQPMRGQPGGNFIRR